jgi:succinate dehydrogenase / fumarate reductase flavoprotein subunit
MGGIRVNPDTQMSTVPGLFAAGECAAGLHGANRLGGNSLSDLLVFGKLAGDHAAAFAKENASVQIDPEQVELAAKAAVNPFEHQGTPDSASPYEIQYALQDMMQERVGIVRSEEEMTPALDGIARLRERAARVAVPGNREYNPGWHTALDLTNLLTVAEAVARAAIERQESRGAHFREDFPAKDAEWGKYNLVLHRDEDGVMQVEKRPLPEIPAELQAIIEEMK